MKKIFCFLLFCLFFFFYFGCGGKTEQVEKKDSETGTITVSGAFALYPLVVKWGEEFKKSNPGVKIDISAGGAGKGMADVLSSMVDIGMISREIFSEEIKKGIWWISVAKDAVVPTMNSENPFKKQILETGIRKVEFCKIWVSKKIENWNQIVNSNQESFSINVYTRSDACGAAKTWAKFLNVHQEDLNGVGVYGDPGVTEAVKKDVMSIGYNNINYAYNNKTGNIIQGISVIPIDINNNNKIDDEENFYGKRYEIVKAIASGKYPSPPSRELYLVCKGKPNKIILKKFLKWILTDGQKYVKESGYVKMQESTLNNCLEKLD